ncbi:MAG: DNA polymerase III subunit beta [Treponema sp.]|nr:DNA polymerase III subunit beta [Treponema sp.]
MKFTFDRDAMIKEIAVTQEIVNNKSPLSILANILLIAENNTLTIKATNASGSFMTKLPVDIQEPGVTTIFCDKFMSILSALPSGEVEFNQNGITVDIKPFATKDQFQLKSMASEKFPEIPSAEGATFFEVSSKEFKELVSQTIFAVSEENSRFFLTGVYLEKADDKLIMVATDGHRLSYAEKEIAQGISDFNSSIIPTKVLYSVIKNAPSEGNIFISVQEKLIFFKFGNYEYSSLLIDGKYPNYRSVIPANQTNSFEIDKKEFESALKRITIMVDKKGARVLFKLESGKLTLLSPDSDLGKAQSEIPCKYEGEGLVMALNPVYVEEPLKVIDTDRIVFEFTESSKAVTLRPEPAADYFHVIMTMNVE